MNKYHKIQTVFFRDPENNMKTLLEGQWSKPEFEYLKDNLWECTEKIDGTNIRILWDGKNLEFRGKSDNAEIPKHLLVDLKLLFTPEKLSNTFTQLELGTTVCLYGEGYGKKIQKGGNYIADSTSFILFDVKIGPWWMKRDDLEIFAKKLQINIVPILGYMTLEQAIEKVRNGFTSTISENPEYIAEGLICKPKINLSNRGGQRVITKIKHKDFV